MAKCAICEKGQITGHRISIERSQVSRRANRKWKPNVKKVKIVEDNGSHRCWGIVAYVNTCFTSCYAILQQNHKNPPP